MTPATGGLAAVDLATCAAEPIHIPGHVQPHGVLLAFDLGGRLTHASRNAPALFPLLPTLGLRPTLAQLGGDPELQAALVAATDDAALAQDGAATTIELRVRGVLLDVVLHAFGGRVLAEFERRDPAHGDLAVFATMAHRSMARLRHRRDIDSLLADTVAAVRGLTGFDRVMAYRFHHDDSGEVVAELAGPGQVPYLGRRFPASDIPAQARRLYTLNTLRLIADVNDVQVPIDGLDVRGGPRGPALDLSYAVLRSVSPIHIEYLRNIGVAASMSLSIIVNGRLWGLVACHHTSAHRVPYAVRMACDVLAQIVSSSVQSALEKTAAALGLAAATVRARLADAVLHDEDLLKGLAAQVEGLRQVLVFDSCLLAHAKQRVVPDGLLAPAACAPLLAWLDGQPEPLVARHELSLLPEALQDVLRPWRGLLAVCFDRSNGGWLVLLRHEQLETVTWSGPPDTLARRGPLGARLTPDGSFAEWRQVVEGTAVPWSEAELGVARQLLNELGRTAALRRAETDRARDQLLMVLGHDLRDPLYSIGIAARILERDTRGSASLGRRIVASTGRMERLITQVLDISRLKGGLGLGMHFVPCDLAELLRGLLDDTRFAHPGLEVVADLPGSLPSIIDPDRFCQAVGNLVGNARQHGVAGVPITVRLAAEAGRTVLRIANRGQALVAEVMERLFEPLKPGSRDNPRNPNGLGLGLYIANEVVKGHGGTLTYGHDGTDVVFTVGLPHVRG
ncbi:MAG: ATP-binding protein [Pseudomonadota bacterium]